MRKKLSVFSFLISGICFINTLYGQPADTLEIKVINISSHRSSLFSQGKNNTIIDSSSKANWSSSTLAELLIFNTTAFVKSYGSGGSAVLSARGTEARHNAISWNGFNINSPTLGLTDLSLIPASVADEVNYIPGGSGPVNGNSALGSLITLENKRPDFAGPDEINAAFSAGSFGNVCGDIKYILTGNNFESHTAVFYSQSENNFKYINTTHRDKPLVRQTHSGFNSYGISQFLHIKLSPTDVLSAGAWYQVTSREIPPLMTSPGNFSEQRDSNLRTFIGYEKIFKKSTLKFKGALFREHQFYDDEKHLLHLRYDVTSYWGEMEWRVNLNEKVTINSGAVYNNSEAAFHEYSDSRNRITQSFFTGMLYRPFNDWDVNFCIRKEFVNSEQPPIIPSIGIEGNLWKKKLMLKVAAGKHFNLPSMNDLYWIPGGNINLKPEEALSGEIGFTLFNNTTGKPRISVTAFSAEVDNWIKWQPSNDGYYKPDNLRKVSTQGIEASVSYSLRRSRWLLNIRADYVYCNSYITKSDDIYSSNTINKQLIYIPQHLANSALTLSYSGYSFILSHQYTGTRYTTSDNTSWLDPFIIGNLTLEKIISTQKHQYCVYMKIHNLYDSTYQVLAYRPTPGRWFTAGFKLNFNLNNKNHS